MKQIVYFNGDISSPKQHKEAIEWLNIVIDEYGLVEVSNPNHIEEDKVRNLELKLRIISGLEGFFNINKYEFAIKKSSSYKFEELIQPILKLLREFQELETVC